MTNDVALLEQYAQTRDAEAFAELVRRYAGAVYGTCLRTTGDPYDTEDVAQECFMELARRAGSVTSSVTPTASIAFELKATMCPHVRVNRTGLSGATASKAARPGCRFSARRDWS